MEKQLTSINCNLSVCVCVCVRVCVCVASGEKELFFVVWWWSSNPWRVLIDGSFFHCRVVWFQLLTVTCSIIFAQLLDSKCAYAPGSIRITQFDHHSRSPHPISGNSTLICGKTRGRFSQGILPNPPLKGMVSII